MGCSPFSCKQKIAKKQLAAYQADPCEQTKQRQCQQENQVVKEMAWAWGGAKGESGYVAWLLSSGLSSGVCPVEAEHPQESSLREPGLIQDKA